ncbi:hypothetical protein pEaSNUABM37_00065 [Erwinia phage pEa_SNUABM_37]|nr:hypothetical protein pEaSNUABM37_00065 [Erwinia phage pEa_SNUABM_37]QXO10535.1 hypothetical protein pEaSNUABM48_00065 [Erwinia phage pEa_SNUABM_48]
MSEEKRTAQGVSVKFPTEPKNDMLSYDEFIQLFDLSGDKSKSVFIHNAIRHYASVVRDRIDQEQQDLAERSKKISELFPPKP